MSAEASLEIFLTEICGGAEGLAARAAGVLQTLMLTVLCKVLKKPRKIDPSKRLVAWNLGLLNSSPSQEGYFSVPIQTNPIGSKSVFLEVGCLWRRQRRWADSESFRPSHSPFQPSPGGLRSLF